MPVGTGRGAMVYGSSFAGGNFAGGGISPPLGFPKFPTASRAGLCLVQRQKDLQIKWPPKAVTVDIIGKNLLFQTLGHTLWTHRMQYHWHLHCTADTPKFRQGKTSPRSKNTKCSHKISPPKNFPPPVPPGTRYPSEGYFSQPANPDLCRLPSPSSSSDRPLCRAGP